jgi:hypothetical protein
MMAPPGWLFAKTKKKSHLPLVSLNELGHEPPLNRVLRVSGTVKLDLTRAPKDLEQSALLAASLLQSRYRNLRTIACRPYLPYCD